MSWLLESSGLFQWVSSLNPVAKAGAGASASVLSMNCCSCSVAQSCLTICDPMDCSMPGFPILHHLLELAQTHIHWIGDAIQPSGPLSSPSPAFSLSQHQGLFYESALCIRWPECWSFNFIISPFSEYSGLIYLLSKGFSRVFSSTTVQKHQFFDTQLSL